jgi:hypothetical protein
MEISKLENIGNVQLFFILKFVNENHSYNKYSFDDIEDDDFKGNCDSACKVAGIGDIDFVDYNFILATLIINKNYDFTSSKPTGIIEKPTAHLYSFDIDEHRVEYVRRSYKHEITSYLVELIRPTVDSMENEGAFDYYDGQETDTDYYDGETTDIKFDKSSIRKLK